MSLQVDILEQSFKAVAPKAEEFVASFYSRLFSMYPEIQPLFKNTDMRLQRKMLLGALALVVENLRHPEALYPALREMGKRHVGYGVKTEHYRAVGAALLSTLATYLGPAWTPDVESAWSEAYGLISSLMLDGADAAGG